MTGGKIGPAGAKAISVALKTNTTVTSLNLSGYQVEQILESEKVRLNKGELTDNKIGCFGVTVLGEALKTNSTLTSLQLDCCHDKQVPVNFE